MIRVRDVLSRISTREGLAYYGVVWNGRDFALCPFHQEQTPSFHYIRSTDRYYCFSCGRSGNLIDFAAERFHFTLPGQLPQVLQMLDREFALGLDKPLSRTEEAARREAQQLEQRMREAAGLWNEELQKRQEQWISIYRILYGRYLTEESAPKEALAQLLGKLEEALEEAAGGDMRLWEARELSQPQNQWVQWAEARRKVEQPAFCPDKQEPQKTRSPAESQTVLEQERSK